MIPDALGKMPSFPLGYGKCRHLEPFCPKVFGFRAICHIRITHSRETQTHQDIEMIKAKQKHDSSRKGLLIARWAHGMPDKVQ